MGNMDEQRRRYIRHPSDIPITYELIGQPVFRAAPLKNISLGGVCFQAEEAIGEGVLLRIRIDLCPPFFAQGRVVWCQARPGYYEIGLQFLDADTGFRARMVEQICHIEQYKRLMLEQEGRQLSSEAAAQEWIANYAHDFPR